MCLDTAGVDAALPHVEAARDAATGLVHPMLFDPGHLVDEAFGMINVPNAVWINEAGDLVRPSEPAWPDASSPRQEPVPSSLPPGRIGEMMTAASKIVSDREGYVAAIRDWAEHGSHSRFVLGADEVIARSEPRGMDEATAAAHFELAQYLHRQGHPDSAIEHFRASHKLHPDNWTYRRQAWSMQSSPIDGPLERFWQGPLDDAKDDWPYDSDWVTDIEASGPENYYRPFVP